jgi:hypothetical protein
VACGFKELRQPVGGRAANSGAVSTEDDVDPDVAAWPELPEHIKAAIVALAGGAGQVGKPSSLTCFIRC